MEQHRLNLIFQTIRRIKPIQLYYQVYYRVKNKINRPKIKVIPKTPEFIYFTVRVKTIESYAPDSGFTFLNKSKQFCTIDWNFSEYGKLWTYNLNYFDFLLQQNLSIERGLEIMHDFCSNSMSLKDGHEPYPISLRTINWVKFLSQNEIRDEKVEHQLYTDLHRLANQLEYHLLANHLLENGFGLLFGSYYFQDEKLYKKAKKIIRLELKEQILPDGGHYELTPMYHQIILQRILDCYQLVSKNVWKNHELISELKDAASSMLGWLGQIQFSCGALPLVNDSTNNIAPTPSELFAYANYLGISKKCTQLKESGYRIFRSDELELLVDVGQIAPSYQPGHSHADSLQFILYFKKNPIIIDTGISTYEKNERRQLERSTSSHNTITINKENSSQVWGGFRVGRRANVKIHRESNKLVAASHDGYRAIGISCQRVFQINESIITISDSVTGKTKGKLIEGHLHFHPNVNVEQVGNELFLNQEIKLYFPEDCILEIEKYSFCQGFNQLIIASKIIYTFQNEITFKIHKA